MCSRCCWYRWQICRQCHWYRWQVATGVIDTRGKFATGVVYTLTCEYICEFSKKFEMILMLLSGAWGKVIHEKNLKQKISWHCPFNSAGRRWKFQGREDRPHVRSGAASLNLFGVMLTRRLAVKATEKGERQGQKDRRLKLGGQPGIWRDCPLGNVCPSYHLNEDSLDNHEACEMVSHWINDWGKRCTFELRFTIWEDQKKSLQEGASGEGQEGIKGLVWPR